MVYLSLVKIIKATYILTLLMMIERIIMMNEHHDDPLDHPKVWRRKPP